MKLIQSLLILMSLSIALLVSGCSDDNSSGATPDDPPEIPEAAPAEVDVSYFNDADVGFEEEYETFTSAKLYAAAGSGHLTSRLVFGESYFNMSAQTDADFDDGWWVWTYNYQGEDGSLNLKTQSREVSGRYEWQVYISGSAFDEEGLDEFLFLDGYTTLDESNGEWNMYLPDESGVSTAYFNYEWNITSETEYELNSIIYLDDEDEYTINYERNGAENLMNYNGFDDSDIIIFWNTDTGMGWLEEDGDRQCWDQSYQQTAC